MADDVKVVDASPSIFWTRHILRELGTRGKLSRPKVVFDGVWHLQRHREVKKLLVPTCSSRRREGKYPPVKIKANKSNCCDTLTTQNQRHEDLTIPYPLYRNTPEDQALGIWVLGGRCRCAQPLGPKTELCLERVCARA